MTVRRRSAMRGLAALGLGLCAGTLPARADDAMLALDGFAQTCIADQADFNRMTATAADLGWTPILAKDLALVGPRHPPEASQGWRAAPPEFPPGTTIGLTSGHYNGKRVQTCTMFVEGVDGRAFEAAMVDRFKARRTARDDNETHETRVYDVKAGSLHLVVVLTLAKDPAVARFSVGAVAEGS